jgi:hypothetical protein
VKEQDPSAARREQRRALVRPHRGDRPRRGELGAQEHGGLELYGALDEFAVQEALRVTDDCFRLMGHVLDEWLGEARL